MLFRSDASQGVEAQTLANAYLAIDAAAKATWEAHLGPARRRVGIAWAGRAAHSNDHNRSMPCAALLPLLALNAEIHCLQRDISGADREWLAGQIMAAYRSRSQVILDSVELSAMHAVRDADALIAELAKDTSQ